MLAKIPDTGDARARGCARKAAITGAPLPAGANGQAAGAELEEHMDALLERVKADDEARQELVDLLETMDPSDPRRDRYRRALASKLF